MMLQSRPNIRMIRPSSGVTGSTSSSRPCRVFQTPLRSLRDVRTLDKAMCGDVPSVTFASSHSVNTCNNTLVRLHIFSVEICKACKGGILCQIIHHVLVLTSQTTNKMTLGSSSRRKFGGGITRSGWKTKVTCYGPDSDQNGYHHGG